MGEEVGEEYGHEYGDEYGKFILFYLFNFKYI